ncbi:MAG: hypothetical protein J3K34DRAFT_476665 [Monoraphidium minutum]|nr:MAG: hypothetical protein J3K34DRAFT_476665 [Monoraphidium minutum]
MVDVLDACAAVPEGGARVAARLRAMDGDIGVLEAAWPQVEALLQAPADQTPVPGAGPEQQQQQQQDGAAPAAAQAARPPPPPAAQALCESVAAALGDLQPPQQQGPAKRLRLSTAGGAAPARSHPADRSLSAVVAAVRAAAPHLQVELMNSFGNARAHYPRQADEVRMLCPGVFCAAVALAGAGRPEPVRVCVDAADAAADVHGWAASPHQCFQRITALAARAAAYFTRAAAARQLLAPPPALAAAEAAAAAAAAGSGGAGGGGAGGGAGGGGAALEALECLLLWLACYSDLFSRPCSATGKLLCWEPGSAVPLPPVVRPFKLTREQLAAAARDPSLRDAYHAAAAPPCALLLQVPPAAPAPAWAACGDGAMARLLAQ